MAAFTILWIVYLLFCNYESDQLLKINKTTDGTYINKCIMPYTIDSMPKDYVAATLIFKGHCNFVFTIAYAKGKNGGRLPIKLISLRRLIKSLINAFTGVNAVMILAIKDSFLFSKSANLNDYLFTKFMNPGDERKIVHKDGKLLLNPGLEKLFELMAANPLIKERGFRKACVEKLLALRIELKAEEFYAPTNRALIRWDNRVKIEHTVYLGITKGDDYLSQTKVGSNILLERPDSIVIHNFDGDKGYKSAGTLLMKENAVIQRDYWKSSTVNILHGFDSSKDRVDLLSTKFIDDAIRYLNAKDEFVNWAVESGWTREQAEGMAAEIRSGSSMGDEAFDAFLSQIPLC